MTRERKPWGNHDAPALTAMRRRLRADAVDDRIIAYRVTLREVFDGLRALIGQLSGLLILAQTRPGRELSDLPPVAIARERWRRAVEQLARLNPPQERAADRDRLQQSAAHIDGALAAISRMRGERRVASIEDAARHLNAAYRLMQSVCDHGIGLAMVDLRHACCGCGRTPVIERGGT